MKFLKELAIILAIVICFEYISLFIKDIIIIPGSIMGMAFLFFLLHFNIIKLELIECVSDFFLKNITLFLIPVGLSILKYFSVIKYNIIPIIICGVFITIISTALTMKILDILLSSKTINEKGSDNYDK